MMKCYLNLWVGLCVLCFSGGCISAEPNNRAVPQPVKLSQADIDGAILTSAIALRSEVPSELGNNTVVDAEVFLSSDRKMDAGVYQSGPSKYTINDGYGVDEFMYFLKGSVTLTSSDGRVTQVNPGEAVMVGKEWIGVWESTAYTKIYVIYSPEPLVPAQDGAGHES